MLAHLLAGERDRPHAAGHRPRASSARAPSCSTRSPRRPASPRRRSTGDLSEAVGRLEAVAHTDDLTGLHNRRSWIEAVRRELAAGTDGALLICDVDGFKSVNDTHGHRAGDLVLTEVARVLARHGVAGRLGGDEFGVWVREERGERPRAPSARSSTTSRARCRSSSSPADPPVGITRRRRGDAAGGAEVMELLEAADRELYAASRAAAELRA